MSYPIHRYCDPPAAARPVIALGHANGFPPETYTPLASALCQQYEVVSLPARPLWGDAEPEALKTWQMLADDYGAGVRQHGLGKVIGIGHSMSGTAIMMASVQHPDLFHAIVLLDPVILPRHLLRLMHLFRWLPIQPKNPLVEGALRRRRHWDNFEDAYQRFRQRSLFQRCSDEVVRLYTESITQPNAQGIELRYTPEWEAQIYRTIEIDAWRYPPRIQVPCLVLAGKETDTFVESSVKLWRKLRPDIPLVVMEETGHLLPLEKPEQVAAHILEFLAKNEVAV